MREKARLGNEIFSSLSHRPGKAAEKETLKAALIPNLQPSYIYHYCASNRYFKHLVTMVLRAASFLFATFVMADLSTTASAKSLAGPIATSAPYKSMPRFRYRQPPAQGCPTKSSTTPGSANCTELFYEQRIDHFTSTPPPLNVNSYLQRYFLNTDFYDASKPGTIFFYFGNEADVELYVNATGLMWENAADFNAVLLFAEHRYYGVSQPFGSQLDLNDKDMMKYLSVEQALADYVELVGQVRSDLSIPADTSVIGFGGSYGGMLASWGRAKYPGVFDGVIAASAPIITFVGQDVDPNFYAEGVSYDVRSDGGVDDDGACETNLRKAFEKGWLASLGETDHGRALMSSGLSLCQDISDDYTESGWDATFWLNSALSYMAMGDYPYPSGYIINNDGTLPAFPVVEACKFLGEDYTSDEDETKLIEGIRDFAGIYYNHSGTVDCYNLTSPVNEAAEIQETLWNYQYCTEIFQIFGQVGGDTDIFWSDPWDPEAAADNCADQYWGDQPREDWMFLEYGDLDVWARSTSNIVWSNGELDPWRKGGVNANLSDTLIAVQVPNAGHHVDLFFSREEDTDEILAAREVEIQNMMIWKDNRRQSVASFTAMQ